MDLDAPLGVRPPPKTPRAEHPQAETSRAETSRAKTLLRLASTPAVVVGLLVGAGALAALGFLLTTADPHGGEAYVVTSIPPAAPKPPAAAPAVPTDTRDAIVTGSIAPRVSTGGFGSGTLASALAVAPSAAAPPTGGPLIIDVAKALADRQYVAAIAPTPPQAPTEAIASDQPRVAIFVGGMGIDATATRTATEIMPSAVSFAFVPYGATVAAAVAAAKARGHEILLQVPMQNGPGAAPGPHALRPGETPQQIAEDMAWLMNRLQGYDGVTNMLGAPVTSDRGAMAALLRTIAARGLFFVDDGTSRRSLAPALALEAGLVPGRAEVVLDATSDPAAVRANLEALVAIAKQKGSAIGMASGLPEHLAAIAAFASDLSGRGVKLVPVSALLARDPAVAVAR